MDETDNRDWSSLRLSSCASSRNWLESIPPQTLTMPEVVRGKATMGCKPEEDLTTSSVKWQNIYERVNPTADIQSLSQFLGETNGSKSLILDSEKDHECPESTKLFADNMDHWLSPSKMSGTRGVFTDSPVLEKNGALLSSHGCLSEHSPRTNICGADGPSVVVPSNVEAALNADHKVKTLVWPSLKILPSKVEAEYGMQGQGMVSSSIVPAETILKEKTESLTTKRQYHGTRKCDDTPPELRHRNFAIQARQTPVDSSSNLKGASGIDHKQLLAAANSVHIAKRLTLDNPFWSKMESFFASVSSEDLDFLKKQIDVSDKCKKWLSQMFVDEIATVGPKETEGAGKKKWNDKGQGSVDSDPFFRGTHNLNRFDQVPSLAYRVLGALIDEDTVEDLYDQNEGRSISFQCTNDTSHHDSLNVMAIDPKNCNKALTEVELDVDLQGPENCLLDGVSCNRNIKSHTQSNQCVSSSFHCNEQCSTNGGLSFPVRGAFPVIYKDDPRSNFSLKLSTSDISSSSSQYQMLPLDDKILMELQSIDLHLDSMPGPALVEKSIDQDIAELQVELDQQVRKKTKILSQIDEAIQCESRVEKRNIEQLAMDQLVIMAYKRMMASRGGNSSKKVANKAVEGKAMASVKRTLVRCKEYESTGKSCFTEPSLKEVIFSSPCKKGKKSAVSKLLKNFTGGCRKLTTRKAYPRGQAKNAAPNAEKASSPSEVQTGGFSGAKVCLKHSSVASLKHDSSLSKVKKKVALSKLHDCCTSKAIEIIGSPKKGKKSVRHWDENQSTLSCNTTGIILPSVECSRKYRSLKTKAEQKLDHLSASGSQLHEVSISTNPAINILAEKLSPLTKTARHLPNAGSVEKANLHPLPFDPAESSISNDFGGPDDLNFWNFDVDDLMESDSVGLEVPMDDLSDVPFF